MKVSYLRTPLLAVGALAVTLLVLNVFHLPPSARGQDGTGVLFSNADLNEVFPLLPSNISPSRGQGSPVVLFTDADYQESLILERPSFLPALARVPPPATVPPLAPATNRPPATFPPPPPAIPLATPEARIAFVSDRDGDIEIYVMNTDGSGVTRLTDNPARDVAQSWSPDGRRITFASDRDGDMEIYVMNTDGSGVTQLTDNPARDVAQSWSPDGRRITFASDRDGDMEIYVMNADGSEVTRLTDNSVYDGVSSWSPDGRRIVFTSYRSGNYELYVMNADGSGVIRLTDNTGLDGKPSWPPAQVRALPSPDTATPSPAPSNRPTPTTSPPPTPAPGGPVVDFHAETTETKTGQPVDISLAVVNLKTNPDIDVHVVLRSPTGLLLTGDSCSSVAQCSDAYELSAGAQSAMSLKATANEAGQFTMEAYVTWKDKDGEPAHLKESLVLHVVAPIEGETEVTLHATQTEVRVGEPVRLNLSAINSIVKPPMTLKLMIMAPSGWSLTGTGFATACGAQGSATYKLESGQPRYIDVDMVANQPGNFEVEARMEWYFGDDTSTLERKVETLQLNVLGDPTPTPAAQATGPTGKDPSSPDLATEPDTGGSWSERYRVLLALLLVGIVILAVLGWIFGRPLDRIRSGP